MKCEEFGARLQQLVEHRDDDGHSALREHADQCADCRESWDDYHLLEQVVPVWAAAQPRIDLADRVVELVGQQRRSVPMQSPSVVSRGSVATERQRSGVVMGGGIVACVAAFVAIVMQLHSPESLPGSRETASITMPTDVVESAMPGRPTFDIDRTWESARSAYDELAQESALAASYVERMVSETDLAMVTPEPEAGDEPNWLGGVGDRITPVATEVGRSMSFLLEVVPVAASGPST